jgi:hypothetical protein
VAAERRGSMVVRHALRIMTGRFYRPVVIRKDKQTHTQQKKHGCVYVQGVYERYLPFFGGKNRRSPPWPIKILGLLNFNI